MKRFIISLALLALITPMFVACEYGDQNSNGSTNLPGVPDNPSQLTPGEHKSKLEDIAIEFVNYFEPTDTDDIIRVSKSFVEYLEDFEDMYYAVEMANEIRIGATNLSATNFSNFATRVTEQIIIDINDPDYNILAGYCYEYINCEWVETELSDNHRAVVKWDDAVAELSWGNTTKHEWDVSAEDVSVSVYVPTEIIFTLKIGSVEHLYINIKPNITDTKTLAPSVKARINGGYEVSGTFTANSKGLESQATLKKDGKTIINGNAAIAINDITDLDNWVCEHYWDNGDGETEYYKHLDPGEYFTTHIKTGMLQIDILNLSLIGGGDFKDMAEKIEEIDDKYNPWGEDYNERFDEEASKKEATEICNLVNEKVQFALVYNDSKEYIANIIMQVTKYKDWDYYWDGDSYVEYEYNWYDIEPILLFPDGSKYAFESYFTEHAFRNLIDTIETLAEDFEDIFYNN